MSHSAEAATGAATARSASEDGPAPVAVPPPVIRGKSVRVSRDPETGQEVFLVQDARTEEWFAISRPGSFPHRYAAIAEAKRSTSSPSRANRIIALIRAVLRRAEFKWEWLNKAPKLQMYCKRPVKAILLGR